MKRTTSNVSVFYRLSPDWRVRTPKGSSGCVRFTFTRASGAGVSFEDGLNVLEGVLAIGRQAEPLDAADVSTRMGTARSRSEHPTSVPEESLAALLTSWAWVKRKVKVS